MEYWRGRYNNLTSAGIRVPAQSHPDYKRYAHIWAMCREAYEGEQAIKGSLNVKSYLPYLDEEDTDGYRRYLDRAPWDPSVSSIVDTMTRSVFRRDPTYTNLDVIPEDQIKNVDGEGATIADFAETVVEELIKIGRGALVMLYRQGRPVWRWYNAEDVISWKTDENDLSMVLLRETYYDYKDGSNLDIEEKTQYRVYRMVGGVITSRAYDESLNPTSPVITENVDFLPVMIVNHNGIGTKIHKPPSLDMVNLTIHEFQLAADHFHSMHWSANPTPQVEGGTIPKDAKIGSDGVWEFNGEGKLSFAEVNGQGHQSMLLARKHNEERMRNLGSKVEDAVSRETAEGARARVNIFSSILSNVVNTTNEAITRMMEWHLRREGTFEESQRPTISVERDYFRKLTPEETDRIFLMVQNGMLSRETAFDMLKSGQIIESNVDYADEQQRIESEMPDDPGENQAVPGELTEENANARERER